MKKRNLLKVSWGLLVFLLVQVNFSQVELPVNSGLHYAGCPDLVPTDFRRTIIETPEQPRFSNGYLISIEVAQDDRIYYANKNGIVGIYDQQAKTHSVVGTLNALSPEYMGLQGMALHPDFPTKPWIYLHYTPNTAPAPGQRWPDFRLSRFTITNDQLDMSSEINMIEVPFRNTPDQGVVTNGGTAHQGGRMRFGPDRNLYIMTGDNSSWAGHHYPLTSDENAQTTDLNTSGNTNDYRGKVLRIRPEDNGSYSIPKNNLWEDYSIKLEAAGRHILAAQYRDSTKVKREIFGMGMRSPIAIQIDKVTGWVGTSEAGPNKGGAYGEGGDDFHLMRGPANNGYPFFYGRYYTYNNEDWQVNGQYPTFDWNNPVNFSSWNTGLDTLPPHDRAIFQFEHSSGQKDNMGFGPFTQLNVTLGSPLAATMGPIYWYDKDMVSDVKFPPHLNGRMFISNMYTPLVGVLQVSKTGDSILTGDPIFRDMVFPGEGNMANGSGIHDMFLGHHGELYLSTFEGQISRIDYVGSCKPNNPTVEVPGCKDPKFAEYDPDAAFGVQGACRTPVLKHRTHPNKMLIDKEKLLVKINATTFYSLKLFSLNGDQIQFIEHSREPEQFLTILDGRKGIFFVQLIMGQQRFTDKLVLY